MDLLRSRYTNTSPLIRRRFHAACIVLSLLAALLLDLTFLSQFTGSLAYSLMLDFAALNVAGLLYSARLNRQASYDQPIIENSLV